MNKTQVGVTVEYSGQRSNERYDLFGSWRRPCSEENQRPRGREWTLHYSGLVVLFFDYARYYGGFHPDLNVKKNKTPVDRVLPVFRLTCFEVCGNFHCFVVLDVERRLYLKELGRRPRVSTALYDRLLNEFVEVCS